MNFGEDFDALHSAVQAFTRPRSRANTGPYRDAYALPQRHPIHRQRGAPGPYRSGYVTPPAYDEAASRAFYGGQTGALRGEAQGTPDPDMTPLQANAYALADAFTPFPSAYRTGQGLAHMARGDADADPGATALNAAQAALFFLPAMRGAREPMPQRATEPAPPEAERYRQIPRSADVDRYAEMNGGVLDPSKVPGWVDYNRQQFLRGNESGAPQTPFDDWIGFENDVGERNGFPEFFGLPHSRADMMPALLARQEANWPPGAQHDMESLITMGRHSTPRELADILSQDLGDYGVGGPRESVPLLGSPDIAMDPLANPTRAGMPRNAAPPWASMPNENRYLFGAPPPAMRGAREPMPRPAGATARDAFAAAEEMRARPSPDAGQAQVGHQAYLDSLRGQGFDTDLPLYRGLGREYEPYAFDTPERPRFSRFATSDPAFASHFANHYASSLEGGANIMPGFVRSGRQLEVNVGGDYFRIPPSRIKDPEVRRLAMVEHDVAQTGSALGAENIAYAARRAGYDSVRFVGKGGRVSVAYFDDAAFAPRFGHTNPLPDGSHARPPDRTPKSLPRRKPPSGGFTVFGAPR